MHFAYHMNQESKLQINAMYYWLYSKVYAMNKSVRNSQINIILLI